MRASENVHAHNVAKLTSKYETRLAEQERCFVNVYYIYVADNIYYHSLTCKHVKRTFFEFLCCIPGLFIFRKTTKKHHTRNAMDRLVEDLIQESMSKGDFDKLSGAGKPLPQRVIYNPYEDYTTYKVKKVKKTSYNFS